ncbi:hypothetical protein [Thioclava sp. GXIMD4216]|uniref:PH domain-containing protein n=1 Tax=Thioclava litoralis TaxID=3076557 RepID=A0ABZ1E0H0_9RHOB|nr:hypothetical protein RPE78_04540 [Thioclava sp. FTW29]
MPETAPLPDPAIDLAPQEQRLAVFRADRRRFFSVQAFWITASFAVALFVGNLITSGQNLMALLGMIVMAQLFGMMMAYRRVFSTIWCLTDRRLIGPRGRSILLLDIQKMVPFLGDVQIINTEGRRFRIEHMADAQETIARIEAARASRASTQP